MSQCFTYSIPPHTLPFLATASHICVAEPRPHTYGVRHLPCGSLTTEPCRPTACNPCGYPRLTARYSLLPANSTDATPAPPAHPILNSSFFILNWTYTFSAKEKDIETGLSYFGSRYYSPDLSIWLSVDPMAAKYPSLSPYVYCADNPVKLVDPNGDTLKLPPGTSPEFQKQFKAAIDYLNTNKAGGIASYLHKSKITYYIKETSDNNSGFVTGERTIYWNPNVGVFTDNGVVLSPTTVLNHEFGHALVYDLACHAGKMKEYYADSEKDSDPNYGTKNDMYVITRIEQRTAKALGEIEKGQVTRTNHSGTFVITKGVTSNEVVK